MSRPRAGQSGNGRHAVVFFTFITLLGLVAARLVWIQIVAAPVYAEKATHQRLRNVEVPARRGTIYDREGEPLAVSVEARSIYVTPSLVKDKPGTARALASALGGNPRDYLLKLQQKSGFVYIERKVDLERAQVLQDMELKGVGFIEDYRRMYPSGELACQVLGFVGVDDKGLAGVESYYDELLGGTQGVFIGEMDLADRPIPGGIRRVIEPVHGHDVVLTIDKDIQYEAQVELTRAVRKWGAKSGSVVVMNPKNGEIYAMATAPGFNPNSYGESKPEHVRNKPLTDAYEPGSTLKCLTAAAAIEEGIYTPESMFELPPTIRVGDRTIHEAHGRSAVRWSLTDIVTQSSNVGTVKIGLRLGERGLYDAFSAFGLTEAPGTDFPGTTKGWLPPVDQWSASSIGNIPFGQGVSVTPVQLARAIAAIANDGVLTTPHFLLEVPHGDDGRRTWPTSRAISKESARTVTRMLEAVVTEGTGAEAAVTGYAVAGKTGTAQKARSDGRGYKGGGYVGSFIGYLPAEDPQLLICVTLDQPTNAIYGGVVAGPTFSRVAQFSVSHLKIPPSSRETTPVAGASVGTVSDDVPGD